MSVHIHKKDGVNYIISAKREGSSFFAFWTCDSCNEKGGCGETSKTEQDAVDAAKVNLEDHHELKHSYRAAAPRGISRRAIIVVGVIGVLIAAIVYVVTCVDFNDWQAIQGEWETVSVTGNGIAGDWSFSANGIVDGPSGYRSHYSMNPLLHTITWADGKAYGTYELDGDDLKIYDWDWDEPQIVWTLKKVRSY